MATYDLANELFDYIMANECEEVWELLADEINPNLSFNEIEGIPPYSQGQGVLGNIVKDGFLRNQDDSFHATPLHAAILNCYFNYHLENRRNGGKALSIFLELLKRGADTEAKCLGGITLKDLGRIENIDSEKSTPLKFIDFLYDRLDSDYDARNDDDDYDYARYSQKLAILALLKKELMEKSSAVKNQVFQFVANTYDKLLFSENQSDIKFVCSDGAILHAHRCILAAASSYFQTAFQGPWEENTSSGEWKTAHPSGIMKVILTVIYIGDSKLDLLDLDPVHLLSAATEFQLESLLLVAEQACFRTLNTSNVKELLEAAHLYGNASLKNACFQFIRTNAATLLVNLNIVSLATEKPALWAELSEAISSPASGANKRARLD